MRLLVTSALGLALAATVPTSGRAQDAAADPVVAVVNGDPIHRSALEQAQQRLPEQYRQVPLHAIFDPLLDQVIGGKLLVAEAERQKLQDTPAVQQQLALARDEVLRNGLLQATVDKEVTEAKVRAAFEAAKTQPGFAQEEVHAQHILVESEEEARKITAELEKGADFAALAKEHSTDPSAKDNAGDLGYFGREAMVPEFAEAAFTMEPGTISKDPVQSQFGWHVIKVLDRRTATPDFATQEPELRQQLARDVVNNFVAQLNSAAKVERFNIDGSPKAAEPKPN
jgi:peptidyl-prolyl cis-trans isomerase C